MVQQRHRKQLDAFEDDLKNLINKHSLESLSDTPDFLLAKYLMQCLELHQSAILGRDGWYALSEREDEHPDKEAAGYISFDGDGVIWGVGVDPGESLDDGRQWASNEAGLTEIMATKTLIDHVDTWGGDPDATPWDIADGVAYAVHCGRGCVICNPEEDGN